jgi:hypothetical protein
MKLDPERKKIILIGFSLLAALLMLAVMVYFLGRDQSAQEEGQPAIDSAIEDSVFDPTIHATITEDTPQLEERLGYVDDIYMAITTDLHVFGRSAYEIYKNNASKPIGFKITSDVAKKDSIVTFEGHYGSSKNKVSVRVTMLGNDRISISITDTATKLNVDSELPSNSKINQFIGGLPMSGEGYNITYVSDDTVNIGLYFRDPSLRDRAHQDIVNKLGEEETKKLNISITFPSAGF